MNIKEAYALFEISASATNDEISSRYKKLAMKYHPDRNRNRSVWAHEAMTNLNEAYALIMSFRFQEPSSNEPATNNNHYSDTSSSENRNRRSAADNHDKFVDQFVALRETSKDSLYRYYQYSLYNSHHRQKELNKSIYDKIVSNLRKCYHAINRIEQICGDDEIENHCHVFADLIYNFYRSSECVTVLDSYEKSSDVQAFMEYKHGEEHLLKATMELFYERHNRGSVNISNAYQNILKAQNIFITALQRHTKSSWVVEIKIKLEFTYSLQKYIELFFNT